MGRGRFLLLLFEIPECVFSVARYIDEFLLFEKHELMPLFDE